MPFDTHNTYVDRKFTAPSGTSAQTIRDTLPSLTYAGTFKRFLDVALILISLPIVLPVISFMALLVALDGHSPFYSQKRVGHGGRIFRMLKIRTMVHDADALLKRRCETDAAVRQEWDSTQKLKDDFRVTPIGRILRKTSLDELPQLFNVLSGSMSLVGPRPMMPEQKELYPGRAYYRLRPGITGFWQISERNHCNFCDRAKFDNAYEQSLSFQTDLIVLLRTIKVVLRGTGY